MGKFIPETEATQPCCLILPGSPGHQPVLRIADPPRRGQR
jgi:hypothetical protein